MFEELGNQRLSDLSGYLYINLLRKMLTDSESICIRNTDLRHVHETASASRGLI